MPAFASSLQKSFKLNIVDELPQAVVDNIGGIHWLKCCPLCGCTHQILGVDVKQPYTPLCQKFPLMYKTEQATCRKLYPDVTQYTTVRLTMKKGK